MMMRKTRTFRPAVPEMRLEDRVVLSVAPAALFAPASKPVASRAEVSAALNQIHGALLSYQSSVTNAVHYAQAQIAAGKVTQSTAAGLLDTYIGNKTSLLFFQTRAAAGNLPFGSGFNGYLSAAKTSVGDLPSGSDSLYLLLARFPTQTSTATGPIYTLQNNVFTKLSNNNFTGVLAAVNSAAIRSTYAQVKATVSAYVVNGVKAHDFTYHS